MIRNLIPYLNDVKQTFIFASAKEVTTDARYADNMIFALRRLPLCKVKSMHVFFKEAEQPEQEIELLVASGASYPRVRENIIKRFYDGKKKFCIIKNETGFMLFNTQYRSGQTFTENEPITKEVCANMLESYLEMYLGKKVSLTRIVEQEFKATKITEKEIFKVKGAK